MATREVISTGNELSAMAYTTIPDEAEVAISFRELIKLIQ